MIIVNSGAYVIREFQSEFGKIPPSLLPIGNFKLIEHQLAYLKRSFSNSETIVLSLPASYPLAQSEKKLLQRFGGTVVQVPDDLTLAESILFVLNTMGESGDSIILLHGDTLIGDLPEGHDVIGVATTTDDYPWEIENADEEGDLVWCGFFRFSSARALMSALATSRQDFVLAVRCYAEKKPMTLHHIENWHDLGHVNTYFRSRACFTTQRVFNALDIDDGIVVKSGMSATKIQAEAAWFAGLPCTLKKYVPQLIEQGRLTDGKAFYSLEYLPLVPLNEIYVHGKNSPLFWKKIFALIAGFMSAGGVVSFAETVRPEVEHDSRMLYAEKTWARLALFAQQSGLDIDRPVMYERRLLPTIRQITASCCEKSLALPVHCGVMHGDLCLSNILFDSRGDLIKVIDPRGVNEAGQNALFGDQKYDLAKMTHSIIGLYDFIIAGEYQLSGTPWEGIGIAFDTDERIASIQTLFLRSAFLPQMTITDVMPVVVLLFLSMLPLHADRPDRQQAMLANALRLYAHYVAGE